MPAAYLRAPDVSGVDSRYVNGCTGKIKMTAEGALAVIKRKRNGSKFGRFYRCRACGHIHVSSYAHDPHYGSKPVFQ